MGNWSANALNKKAEFLYEATWYGNYVLMIDSVAWFIPTDSVLCQFY